MLNNLARIPERATHDDKITSWTPFAELAPSRIRERMRLGQAEYREFVLFGDLAG